MEKSWGLNWHWYLPGIRQFMDTECGGHRTVQDMHFETEEPDDLTKASTTDRYLREFVTVHG